MMALPLWDAGILMAVCLVMFIHLDHVFPITALLKQLVSFFLVEGAAHTMICRMCGEDCRATDSLTFPYAFL